MSSDPAQIALQPSPPRLAPGREELTVAELVRLGAEATIECATVIPGERDIDEAFDLTRSNWESVAIDRATLAGGVLDHVTGADIDVSGADLSNVSARGSSLQRVRIHRTRAIGIGLSESRIKHAVFDEVAMDFARMRFAKLERARFVGCQLRDADFSSAHFASVVFEHCDLSGSDFTKTTFDRCEIHSCTLEGAHGFGSLRGVSMSLQDVIELAPVFAAALGVHVITGEAG